MVTILELFALGVSWKFADFHGESAISEAAWECVETNQINIVGNRQRAPNI